MLFWRRVQDFGLAILITGLGFVLVQDGNQLPIGRLTEILPEIGWTLVCLLLGGGRIAALIINGLLQNGATALARIVIGAISVWLWSQILAPYAFSSLLIGQFSATALLYTWLIYNELVCIIRAGMDFSAIRQHHASNG